MCPNHFRNARTVLGLNVIGQWFSSSRRSPAASRGCPRGCPPRGAGRPARRGLRARAASPAPPREVPETPYSLPGAHSTYSRRSFVNLGVALARKSRCRLTATARGVNRALQQPRQCRSLPSWRPRVFNGALCKASEWTRVRTALPRGRFDRHGNRGHLEKDVSPRLQRVQLPPGKGVTRP